MTLQAFVKNIYNIHHFEGPYLTVTDENVGSKDTHLVKVASLGTVLNNSTWIESFTNWLEYSLTLLCIRYGRQSEQIRIMQTNPSYSGGNIQLHFTTIKSTERVGQIGSDKKDKYRSIQRCCVVDIGNR